MTVLEQRINCGVSKQVSGKENCLVTDAGEPAAVVLGLLAVAPGSKGFSDRVCLGSPENTDIYITICNSSNSTVMK